jgi:hypothetical protein
LPNTNIIFSPCFHPQKDRLTKSRTVSFDSLKERFRPKVDILMAELLFHCPENNLPKANSLIYRRTKWSTLLGWRERSGSEVNDDHDLWCPDYPVGPF